MGQILHRIFIRSVQRFAWIIFRNGRIIRAVHLLDKMTLRTPDAVDRGIARLRLLDECLDLIKKLVDMRGVAFEAERLILSAGKRSILIQGGSEDRRMNRFGERRGFPFFEDTLMATFAFI